MSANSTAEELITKEGTTNPARSASATADVRNRDSLAFEFVIKGWKAVFTR